MGTILILFHEDEKTLFARKNLETISRGLQIELSHSLSMQIMIMSWPRALMDSRKIIFEIMSKYHSSIENSLLF